MAEDTQAPKIQIDSDWKAQAQAEKERLAQQAKAGEGPARRSGAAAATGAGGLPPATFEALISSYAAQALFAMGAIPDPRTGQRVQSLDLARHYVDVLTMLEEKTKGNLTEQESSLLGSTLYELRSRYIQLSSAARGY